MDTIKIEINLDIDLFNWIQEYRQDLSIDEFVNMVIRSAMPEQLTETIDS